MAAKWNKIVFCAFAALVVISMIAPIATAEEYRKDHFEITLPNDWYYNAVQKCYESNDHHSRIYLFENAEPTPLDSSSDINYLLYLTKMDKNYSEYKKITVDGQESMLATLRKDFNSAMYGSVLRTDGYVCYVIFASNKKDYGKEEFISLLQGFRVRREADYGFFRFDDVEIKYTGVRLRQSGEKNILDLKFTWHNLSDEPSFFLLNFSVEAYQDGIQLQEIMFNPIETNDTVKIMKGAEIEVIQSFYLRNLTSDIDVIVDSLYDFSNKWPNLEFTLVPNSK